MLNSESEKRSNKRLETLHRRKKKYERIHSNPIKHKEPDDRESKQQERYKTLIENIPCAVYSAYPGKAGLTTFMSNKWKDWTGYSSEELYRNPEAWTECIHRDDREYAVNTYIEACRDRMAYNLEYRIVHKDTGQLRYVRDQGHLSKDEKDAVIRVDGIITDISELKRAEDAIQESENKFRNILDNLGDIAYETDASGNVTYANKMIEKIAGVPLKDVIGKPFLPLLAKENHETAIDVYRRNLNGDSTEYELTFANGKVCHSKTEPLRDETGKVIGVFGIARDVTERRRVEKALRVSEERFKNLFNNALLGLYRTTPDGRILMANPTIVRMLGYDCFEELAGRNLEEEEVFEPRYSRSDFKERIEAEGKVVGLEADWIRRDGTILSVRESARVIRDELGNILYYEGTVEDISEHKRAEKELGNYRDRLEEMVATRTRELERSNKVLKTEIAERKRTEEALRTAELRFRSLIEQTTDAVFCYEYDPPIPTDLPLERQVKLLYDGVLVECNDVCAKSYGADRAEDVIGGRLWELLGTAPGSLDELFTAMIEDGYRRVDGEAVKKLEDGTKRYYLNNGHGVIEDGKLIRVWGTFRDITEHKLAQDALRETTDLLELIFEHTHMMVAYLDPQFNFVRVNRAYAEADERRPSFFPGRNHFDLYPNAENQEIFRRVLETGQPHFVYAKPFKYAGHPERGISYWDWSLAPIKNQQGIVSGLVLTLADVTARIQAEEALKASEGKLNAMLQSISDLMSMMDKDFNILWVNEVAKRRFGDDIVGKKCYEVYHGRQSPCEPDSCLTLRAFQDGQIHEHDTEDTDKDGNTAWFHCVANVALRNKEGEPTAVLEISTDITGRKEAENTLRQYEFMVESAHDAIFFKDRQSRYIIANEKTLESFGLSREQVIGKSDYEIMPDREQARRNIDHDRTVLETCKPKEIIKEMTGANGEKRWFQAIKVPQFDNNGDVIGLIGIARDITKNKQAEEELRIREQKLRALLNAPTESAILVDTKGIILDINRIAVERLSKSSESMIGMGIYDYLPADIAEYRKKRGYEVIRSGKPVRFQDKREGRYYDNNIYPVFDDEGKVSALAVFSGDITERKKAEEALSKSEERFRSLAANSPIGIFQADIEGKCIYVNRAIRKFTGLKEQEHLGDGWAKALHPEDREYVYNEWLRSVKDQSNLEIEYRFVCRDGKVTWVRSNSTPFRNDLNELVGFIGTHSDITDRKRAHEKLCENEMRFRQLVENIREVFWMENVDGTELLYVSHAYEDIWGRSREEFYRNPKIWIDTVHPDDRKRVADAFAKGRLDGSYSEEFRIIRPDGSMRWIWDRSVMIHNEFDEFVRVAGVAEDITERKQAEQALRESEEKFRSLAEQSPNMIFINKKGRIVYANKKCEEVMGYTREELYSPDFDFRTMVGPESIELVNRNFTRHLRGQEVGSYDYCLINKKGRRIEVINASKLIQYEGETAILGVVTDITDRKRAEQDLLESEERLKILFESAPDAIYLIDSEGKFVDGNRAAEELIGFSKDEVIGKSLAEMGLLSAGQLSNAIANLKRVATGKLSGPNEYVLKRKDGTYVSIEVRTFPVKIEGKMLTLGIARDITEHKQTEKELLEHQAKLKSLASQLSLTEERERHRLATDLHDQISQSLVISKIKLDQLRKSSASDDLDKPLDDISNCLGQIIDDTRALTFDLSYPILYELGFEAAVAEWLTDQIQEKHGIKTEFENDRHPKPLDDDIRVLLFRNVRELLINVIKHAEADKVRVSIRRDNEYINVRVEDNGIGFDPVEVTSMATKRAEFGLFSIRERLEQLGGMIEIDSKPDCGSKITMRAPLKYNNSTDRISK